MKEFSLENNEFIPLCDLMKAANLTGSGGEAKHIIAEGRVLVDGAVETRKRCKIRSGQLIEFEGKQVKVL
ncbi:MAG TPA: RNA-binding S4 domain-containing protein [Bacteriovoracaceae bacterium]|nr:RNA-binding S4 domain-containing protein [Bacteriovoracaceae bacterium]